MSVSVIIPTCNRPKFLLEAVESILNQTILPAEIIIGDDSKDNNTGNLIKEELIPKSKVPIKYFHNKPSLFQAGNVDFLIKKVSSEFLLLLHDDDALMPTCLETLLPPLRSKPSIAASFGKQYVMDDNGNIDPAKGERLNKDSYRTFLNTGVVDGEWASIVGMFPNNAFLIRSEIAKKIGYLDNNRAGDAVDFYFGYQVGKNNNFIFVNEYTAKYRITSESISLGSLKLLSSKLQILLEDLPSEKILNKEIKETIKFLINPAISEAIKRGDKKLAWNWMLSSHYDLFTLKAGKRIAMLMNPFV